MQSGPCLCALSPLYIFSFLSSLVLSLLPLQFKASVVSMENQPGSSNIIKSPLPDNIGKTNLLYGLIGLNVELYLAT